MVHLGRLKLLIRPTETCHEMKQQTGRCPKSAAVTCDSKKKRRWHAVGCNRVSLHHKPFGVCVAMSATKHGEFQTTTTHVMQLFTVLLGGGGKGRKREKINIRNSLVHLFHSQKKKAIVVFVKSAVSRPGPTHHPLQLYPSIYTISCSFVHLSSLARPLDHNSHTLIDLSRLPDISVRPPHDTATDRVHLICALNVC